MAISLNPAEIEQALRGLPGWAWEGNALAKSFKLGSFREAINHHPDWTNVFSRVAVRLTTHDAGGKVTAKDVELARKIQQISWVD